MHKGWPGIWIAAVAAAAVIVLQVAAQGAWGFHRDEFLYMAMARHVDWGYWSNPPLIGAVGWLAENAAGTSLFAMRLLPLAASVGTMLLTCGIVRDMGGKSSATIMACIPFVVSPGLLRPGGMLQPVIFDILFWTSLAFIVVRYLRTDNPRWLAGLGLVVGVGLLNKYSIIFFVIALLAAVLVSPHRRALFSRHVLYAVIIAGVLVLPNLVWQGSHGWPVISHMRELAETQLVNVRRLGFLLEQLIIHLPVVLFWIAGLVWLFGNRGRPYRILGFMFVFVVLLLLLLRGKAYYTLGAYPMLFAAGGVWLEETHAAVRWSLGITAIVVGLLLSPFSVPYLSVQSMVSYGERVVNVTGIDGPLRWETGVVHELPQDYADMLGWEELAGIALRARDEAGDLGPTVVFAENYGEAGSVEYYGRGHGITEVLSFSDSYRLWAPDSLPPALRSVVYISEDDDLNFDHLFGSVMEVGRVENRHARERGTTVFLLSDPLPGFFDFYAEEAARAKSTG